MTKKSEFAGGVDDESWWGCRFFVLIRRESEAKQPGGRVIAETSARCFSPAPAAAPAPPLAGCCAELGENQKEWFDTFERTINYSGDLFSRIRDTHPHSLTPSLWFWIPTRTLSSFSRGFQESLYTTPPRITHTHTPKDTDTRRTTTFAFLVPERLRLYLSPLDIASNRYPSTASVIAAKPTLDASYSRTTSTLLRIIAIATINI
jgi:hypothetical protein